ncbi:AraC family transcriptional regulator [Paenibacillus mucilaginosus]|uniref:Transcriptional regulator, AraC family n=1 Tax=Paenibacillus mucilaginosus (strain KNP414) TaxID=1036673 RepID=F8FM69_PAEMK|nr:AraC family transcriptional regulator [Paenibacillus mucilaginosus]AEI38877.1 transcriptional regulator, AraC family [Paenibacillus mucilaginosus KNP414]MCG7217300.1 AraC family transcriptional regulator [Paenibacillus mucilaginosus]WDM27941.1 helix-turn-helix transcriptional regulator [Paenibacillus mucilaginosus]
MNANIPWPSMGVLRMQEGSRRFRLTRHDPSEELAFFVKHYWVVRWDVSDGATYPQEVLPNPCVNLVVEREKSAIFGPSKQKFTYPLHGRGCVFGVKFKPGGFHPFSRRPAAHLADQPLAIGSVFGVNAGELEDAMLSEPEESRMIELAEALLRPKLPLRDEQVPFIGRIVDRIREDRSLTRVDQAADAFGLSVRGLQRLFHQYVGVTPKWVIQLYRLHNAAEAMEQSGPPDSLELSMELGYHDQAHFIKDFKAIVGRTPEQHAKGRIGREEAEKSS